MKVFNFYTMKTNIKYPCLSVLFMLIFIVSAPSVWAGAWCMKQGALYSKFSYNRYFTVYTFDDDGHSKRNTNGSNFLDNNVTWYTEYGISDQLTFFTSVPYKWLKSRYRYFQDGKLVGNISRYHGLGDMESGIKYCFFEHPFVLSGQILTKLAWFYDSGEDVLPGNNQNDYELKILAGKSLWPFPGYCGIELGYRWRTSDPSDEFRYLLEFGVNFTERIFSRIKLDGIKSAKNANLETFNNYSVSFNPSLGLEYDLGKLELTCGYQYRKQWSFEFTYTNYPYGENIGAGDQYSFALVYFWSRN